MKRWWLALLPSLAPMVVVAAAVGVAGIALMLAGRFAARHAPSGPTPQTVAHTLERVDTIYVERAAKAAAAKERYTRARADGTATLPQADTVVAAQDSAAQWCDSAVVVRDSVIHELLYAKPRRLVPWVEGFYNTIDRSLLVRVGADVRLTPSLSLTVAGESDRRLLVGARWQF